MSKLYGLNVGLEEHLASQVMQLQIAPNPSAGATVFSVGNTLAKAELYIHDGSGRMVWQVPWPMGMERYTLPAGTLAPGTYGVRVVSSHAATAGSAARDPAVGYVGRLVVLP